MYPFDRFTDTAKGTMRLAQAEANREGLGFVGVVHLLGALQQQPATVASELMVRLELDPKSIAPDEVSRASEWMRRLGFTRASQAFMTTVALAFEEADNRGVGSVGTADLLIGAVRACGDVVLSSQVREAAARVLIERNGYTEM